MLARCVDDECPRDRFRARWLWFDNAVGGRVGSVETMCGSIGWSLMGDAWKSFR